ncbi:MAG: anthranilate phosphoribosyltransferase [Acidimicrobiia bacterium]|nr:MAG: anthranilate phosphoribosyltransferase [Acidimicrobiia bacterium]
MSEFSWPIVLEQLLSGEGLRREEAHDAMAQIMAGDASEAQIAAFLVALRAKGETADEMTGFVDAMSETSLTVDVGEPVADSVGTGGDRSGTFNISTTAALIAAGAGVKVAKHGNRAASSNTGAADLLEGLGIDLEMSPERTGEMIRTVGFGFLFAPRYHPAMRHAGPARRTLGVRTVFNFLGPLTNPAGPRYLAVGTSAPEMAGLMLEVLKNRGAEAAFVFHGKDGLDELTTTGPSTIHRLKDGEISVAEFTPEDFGVARATIDDLRGGDVAANVAITNRILDGEAGAHRDITLVNAAAVIVAAGLADGFTEGVELAGEAIDSGDARALLDRAVEFSKR